MRNHFNLWNYELIQPPSHQQLAILKNHGEGQFQTEKQNTQLFLQPISKTDRPKIETQISKSTDNYSLIFSKNKRKQFSGYKPYNMNSNKIVKFNYNKNLIHCYRTPKKYEENLKNIIKLRKRFSLQPIELKTKTETSNLCYKSTIINSKRQLPLEELSSHKLPQRQIKQIIREVQKEQYFYHQIKTHNSELNTSCLKSSNLESCDHNFENIAIPSNITLHNKLNKSFKKPPFFKNSEKIHQSKKKIKMQKLQNQTSDLKREDKLSDLLLKEEQRDFNLCGWSFYGNDKSEYYKDQGQKNNIVKQF